MPSVMGAVIVTWLFVALCSVPWNSGQPVPSTGQLLPGGSMTALVALASPPSGTVRLPRVRVTDWLASTCLLPPQTSWKETSTWSTVPGVTAPSSTRLSTLAVVTSPSARIVSARAAAAASRTPATARTMARRILWLCISPLRGGLGALGRALGLCILPGHPGPVDGPFGYGGDGLRLPPVPVR